MAEALDVSFVKQTLEATLHPQIATHYRVELLFLGSLTVVTALCYIATLIHEVCTNSKLWFFRFSQDPRVLEPNALLLWLPLASIYCIFGSAASFWRAQNDYLPDGNQDNMLLMRLLPPIFIGLAQWWTFSSILVGAVHILRHQRHITGYRIRLPPSLLFHFAVYIIPITLFTASFVMSIVANARYNHALGNIDGLLGYIAADQFETEEYALLFATFLEDTRKASEMIMYCTYLTTAELSIQALLFVPASLVVYLSLRKSQLLRGVNTPSNGRSGRLAKMETLSIVFMIYSCAWIIASVIYNYIYVAYINSDSIESDYTRDNLVNLYINGCGCFVAAVFLLLRTFIAKEHFDMSGSSTSGFKHARSFAPKGSTNLPLQVRIVTQVEGSIGGDKDEQDMDDVLQKESPFR